MREYVPRESRGWAPDGGRAGLAAALTALAALSACRDAAPPACRDAPLFGRPSEKTGLSEKECQPRCVCDDQDFVSPEYSEAEVQKALAWTLLDPPVGITSDPYLTGPGESLPADTVCGVLPEPAGTRTYRLVTYASAETAEAAGASVTHVDACGLCSPLHDLAVYLRYNDLSVPVRQCSLDHLSDPPELHLQCLQALGFDEPCAQIWYYNAIHTRDACFEVCINSFHDPHNLPDGSLNPCLLCDEEQSGAVFKRVAGRTRRNTGIPNAICRPCTEVRPIRHDYL